MDQVQKFHNDDRLMHAFDENPEDLIQQQLEFSISDTPKYCNIIGLQGITFNRSKYASHNLLFQSIGQQYQHQDQDFSSPQNSKLVQLSPIKNESYNEDMSGTLHKPFQIQNVFQLKKRVDKNHVVPFQQTIFFQERSEEVSKTFLTPSPMNNLTNQESFKQLLTRQNQMKPRPAQSIMVYYFLKRFLTKISSKRRLKLFFKAKHFSLVGDKASEKQNTLSDLQAVTRESSRLAKYFECKNKMFKRMASYIKHVSGKTINSFSNLIKKLPLIYPQSLTKIIWDIVLCLVLMYFFIMIPIEIAFNNSILFGVNGTITLSFIVFLVLDYLLKMNTVYYEFGKPVTGRREIFSRYFQNGFFIDGLALTTLVISLLNHYLFQTQILSLVLFLFFSQFHYFSKILTETEEALTLSKKFSSIIQLLKLILTLLFIEHMFSCVWYFIAAYKQSQNNDNWMQQAGILNEPWIEKYLASFYFSTVTMLSVGYGDIVPVSIYILKFIIYKDSLERVVSILFMMFACIQLSYSVNTVGDIIRSFLQSYQEARRKMRIINQYMEKKKISFGLQYQQILFKPLTNRIREYLKIYWEQEVAEVIEEENTIIQTLSEKLKNKLIYEAYHKILCECWLFKDHFSEGTKIKLLKMMKTIMVSPENVITSNLAQFNDQCIYFIECGELDVFVNHKGEKDDELMTYKQGSYFGLDEFIAGKDSVIQLSSQKFVKLIILTRNDFIKVLRENMEDYEEFCMIKDQYLLKTSTISQKYLCSSCNCSGHSIIECPLIHLVSDKERIIKQYQWNHIQTRPKVSKLYQRRRKEKHNFNALGDQGLIQETSNIIQSQYPDGILQFYEEANKLNIKEFPQQIQSKTQLFTLQESTFQLQKQVISQDIFPRINNLLEDTPKQINNQNFFKQGIKVTTQQKERMKKVSLDNKHQRQDIKTIRQNFQKIVKKVISINKGIKHSKKNFYDIQLLQNMAKVSKKTNQKSSMQDNFAAQLLLYDNFPDEIINLIGKKDREQLQFLCIKAKMENNQKIIQFENLDICKDFVSYSPQNNFSNVVKTLDCLHMNTSLKDWHNRKPHLQNGEQRAQIMSSSLSHYMLYPFEYIHRFYRSSLIRIIQKEESKLNLKERLQSRFNLRRKTENRGRIRSMQPQRGQIPSMIKVEDDQ